MKVKTIIKKLKIPLLCAALLLPRAMVADNEVGPSPTDVPSSIGGGSGFVEGTTDSVDEDGTYTAITDNFGATTGPNYQYRTPNNLPPNAKAGDTFEAYTEVAELNNAGNVIGVEHRLAQWTWSVGENQWKPCNNKGVVCVTLTPVTYTFNKNIKVDTAVLFATIGKNREVDTAVLFAPTTPDTVKNLQAILDGLAPDFKNENGVSAIVVPTIVKGIVIEKTVALGSPAGLIVAENPFEGDTNTLTPAGVEFFNDIKLYGGDLAVVVGAAAKANAVAAQLVKNGANSEQVLAAPAAHVNNPNTVAVYIVRLPTMADLFAPAPAPQAQP